MSQIRTVRAEPKAPHPAFLKRKRWKVVMITDWPHCECSNLSSTIYYCVTANGTSARTRTCCLSWTFLTLCLLPVTCCLSSCWYRDLCACGLRSKCSLETGTEGSRMGQGKAPGRDIVSSGVPFSLISSELGRMSCIVELVPLWDKGLTFWFPY